MIEMQPDGGLARLPVLLVVDDEKLLHRGYARYFRGRVEVHAAHDFETALAHESFSPADAILLEVSVPGPDGKSFAAWLENHRREWFSRLIVTTGGLEMGLAFRLENFHGCPFLPKPIDPDLLLKRVLEFAKERSA
ncbi:MAG: response regulator [Myxococcales bacterium]|nr:response regulator [Myxococcales bacterium]